MVSVDSNEFKQSSVNGWMNEWVSNWVGGWVGDKASEWESKLGVSEWGGGVKATEVP